MKRVVIESPYAGDVELNLAYARACVKDSLLRDEAPIASHLLYTQPGILNDDNPDERTLGIGAGLEWIGVADLHVFYIDLGWSKGMREAFDRRQVPVEMRSLGKMWTGPWTVRYNVKRDTHTGHTIFWVGRDYFFTRSLSDFNLDERVTGYIRECLLSNNDPEFDSFSDNEPIQAITIESLIE